MLSQKGNITSSFGTLIAVIALSVSSARIAGSAEALWIEGEDYISSSFNRHGWYQNTNIRKDLLSPGTPGLSQGAWHTHYAGNYSKTEATARYRLDIIEGGDYAWWIRLNPFRNHNGGANYSYRYRSSGGAWTPWGSLDVSEARDSMIDLVEPGIDIRFMAWCPGPMLSFTPGAYELELRLVGREGDKENHGGIDVMAFTNFAWAPTGVIPPCHFGKRA